MTIKDIARLANVSISTVSKALNNSPVVQPETKKKIQELAKSLNYFPNQSGRQLRAAQTHMLGFFTNSVSGPYFARFVEAISIAAEEYGYVLSVVVTPDHDRLMRLILGGTYDGAMIFFPELSREDIVQIQNQHVPIVMTDRLISSAYVSSCVFDSRVTAEAATAHLIECGYQEIIYIAGISDHFDNIERYHGFHEVMTRHPNLKEVVIHGNFSEADSFKALNELINSSVLNVPCGIIAANDQSAIGAVKALKAKKFSIPTQAGVVGFDDVDLAAYLRPALTTVHNPIEKQASTAIRTLTTMIEADSQGTQQVLTGHLVVRASTSTAST